MPHKVEVHIFINRCDAPTICIMDLDKQNLVMKFEFRSVKSTKLLLVLKLVNIDTKINTSTIFCLNPCINRCLIILKVSQGSITQTMWSTGKQMPIFLHEAPWVYSYVRDRTWLDPPSNRLCRTVAYLEVRLGSILSLTSCYAAVLNVQSVSLMLLC